jgi:hypothetical protein
LVEKEETIQVHFTLEGEGQKSKEKSMNEKFTWSPTWQVVDKGAWSAGICVRATSKRWDLTKVPGNHDFLYIFLA